MLDEVLETDSDEVGSCSLLPLTEPRSVQVIVVDAVGFDSENEGDGVNPRLPVVDRVLLSLT